MSSVLYDIPGPRAARRYRLFGVATVIALIALVAVIVWKLQKEGQLSGELWEPFVTPGYVEVLGKGLLATIQAAALAIAGAVVIGAVFGAGKLSDRRTVRWPSWLFVEFFRAVPLLMLIIFIWAVRGYPLDTITPLVLGLMLYNGAVLAEIFRAGINAVPAGQSEAGLALGLSKRQVLQTVQFPQAVRIMLPSIISQCIVALKDSSLGFYILAPGLTFAGRQIWREFDNYLQTALVLAVIYIILNLLLSRLATLAERRLASSEGGTVEVVAGQVLTKP